MKHDILSMPTQNAIYQHFKGSFYLIVDVFHGNDGQPTIVGYRPMYYSHQYNVESRMWRTLQDFEEPIIRENHPTVPRFQIVTDVKTLNRAYRSDKGCIGYPNPDKSHPAYQQIFQQGMASLSVILDDLQEGLLSNFTARNSCEPCMYLSIIFELMRMSEAHWVLAHNEDQFLRSVVEIIEAAPKHNKAVR